MSKREFELWLDESGDFDNDERKVRKGFSPSHIGGILTEKGSFGSNTLERIFPGDLSGNEDKSFHSTDEKNKEEVFDKFCQIEKRAESIRSKEKYVRYVLFRNTECIMVIDDGITYQNIMAEGIIKLICELKARFGEIRLNVLIAYRSPKKNKREVVPLEEYERKLKEKLIIEGIHNEIKEKEWSLKTAPARRVSAAKEDPDKRLMAADVVCNCFLTRTTKFKEKKYDIIRSVYEDKDKTRIFSVLSDSAEEQFKELMMANRLGEAAAAVCQCGKPDKIETCMEIAKGRMEQMDADIRLQYSFLKAIIEHYLNVRRAYEQCEKLLKNLLQYFVPILKEEDMVKKLTFDLNFYLFTVYTHMGNVTASSAAEKECDKLWKELSADWDFINLDIRYKNRKIISRINLYDYDGASAENEKLIAECRNIKEILSLHREDVVYDELAKALGTQVQIETSLLRLQGRPPGVYEKAAAHSDEAIREFVSKSDIARQYLYRVQLETEAGQYEKAYQYLCLANGLKEDEKAGGFKDVLKRENNLYQICAYVRLMAEGKMNGWEMADELHEVLIQTHAMQDLEEKSGSRKHPEEIIFWKYACCRTFSSGKISDSYKNAIEICFDEEDLTLNIIGLAVEFERYAFALKGGDKKEIMQYKKSLQKRYSGLMEKDLPDSMKNLFGDVCFEEDRWEYYFDLSRKVTY